MTGAALTSCCACARAPQPLQPHLLSRADLSAAELKYGRAPQHDSSVVYGPEVVIPEGGASIIRSAAPDGLTWVIDGTARHAREIAVGKILFATGRCVGRVLKLTRRGSDLEVVLGPAEMTDIFEKLDVTVAQEVDLTQAIQYPAPQFPNAQFPLEIDDGTASDLTAISRSGFGGGHLSPATYMAQDGPRYPGIIPQPFNLELKTSKPLNNADGIGMEFSHEGNGARIIVQVQLRTNKPRLEAHIGIDHGNVNARVILHNAAGLKLAFDSAVNEQFPGAVRWYSPAGQLSFPLSGPVPLSFDVRQDLYLDAEFAARKSSFSAGGDFDLNADFGFIYQNGKFDALGPKGINARTSVLHNITGVSIGPRRFAMRHAIIATAGLGGAGFTIGPQLIVGTRMEVKKGSDVALVDCRGASLAMGVKGGVGWTIPRPIQRVVNFFLKLINVTPMADRGGVFTDWKYLFNRSAQSNSAICGGPTT